jgi:DNA repair protein RadC
MARYAPQRERIFVVGGRDDAGSLVLVDQKSGEAFASNPGAHRTLKKEYIELPLGQFEDLRTRVGLVRSKKGGKYPEVQISSSTAVATLMAPYANEPQEVVSVILVDTRNVVIGVCEIHRGGLASAVVEPMAVFRPAIIANAAAIIVVHNHPSGTAAHSPEDSALCGQLMKGAALLGLRMLDFVVMGHRNFESYADLGLL